MNHKLGQRLVGGPSERSESRLTLHNEVPYGSNSRDTRATGRAHKSTLRHFQNRLQPYVRTHRRQIPPCATSRPFDGQLLPSRPRPVHLQVRQGVARVGVGQLCGGAEAVGRGLEKKARGKGVPTKAKDKSMYVPTCRSRTSLKKLGNFFSRPELSVTEKTIVVCIWVPAHTFHTFLFLEFGLQCVSWSTCARRFSG